MIEVILEFLIVFEDFILGKKKKSKPNRKISYITIIVLIVVLILIVTLIINLYPLLNEN